MSELPDYQLPNLELRRLLGRGGMASVWLARQISLDREVAVKILSPEFATDEEDVRRFRREAQMAAQLKHPGLVEVYDANVVNGIYYFVMEFVNGYTMGDLLRRKRTVTLEDVLIIAESVSVAMHYAWSQFKMVHCDIKPDNLMVDADGSLKVTDLGLCRSLTHNRDAEHGHGADEVFGTPAYMSPEQIYGTEELDARSDIYELGATLYHLVTGRMLFSGKDNDAMIRCHVGEDQAEDPRLYVPELPLCFVLLLEKMLAKDRNHRPSDWKRLLEDLARVRKGMPPWPALLPPKGSSLRRDS
ncbi:MAG: serine/threonine protein kinase [Kiritimatiellae bacterium]|nr:serine/threonine protein kinase [Kiritimatiellia bacterium]MBP5227659.1 serine/threonine protein kinase [Kiritimatiellia bacterium]